MIIIPYKNKVTNEGIDQVLSAFKWTVDLLSGSCLSCQFPEWFGMKDELEGGSILSPPPPHPHPHPQRVGWRRRRATLAKNAITFTSSHFKAFAGSFWVAERSFREAVLPWDPLPKGLGLGGVRYSLSIWGAALETAGNIVLSFLWLRWCYS